LRQALELALTRNEPTLIEVPCGDNGRTHGGSSTMPKVRGS